MQTNSDKQKIIFYYQDDRSITFISEKLNIHRNTISKWINRYNELGTIGINKNNDIRTVKIKTETCQNKNFAKYIKKLKEQI